MLSSGSLVQKTYYKMGFGKKGGYIRYSKSLNLESFALKDSGVAKRRERIHRGTLGAHLYPLILVDIS